MKRRHRCGGEHTAHTKGHHGTCTHATMRGVTGLMRSQTIEYIVMALCSELQDTKTRAYRRHNVRPLHAPPARLDETVRTDRPSRIGGTRTHAHAQPEPTHCPSHCHCTGTPWPGRSRPSYVHLMTAACMAHVKRQQSWSTRLLSRPSPQPHLACHQCSHTAGSLDR